MTSLLPHVHRKSVLLFAAVTLLMTGLLNGAPWEQAENYRRQRLTIPASSREGFTRLGAGQSGILFTNHLSDKSASENQIRLLGSGVALGDVDRDGWCDVYLCRLEGDNRLYRNLGNCRFEDITTNAHVECSNQFSTGAAFADLDGDQDLDLMVNGLGTGTRLFLNDGQGRFAERTNSGLASMFAATSLAVADVDADGDLDVYVANYRGTTIRSTGLSVLNVNGKRVLRPEDRDQYEFSPEGFILEHGEPDILFLNDGQARFTPVSWTGGQFLDEDGKPLSSAPKDWGLSVMLRDANGDGLPDIYVCNDFWSSDQFWINQGGGRFRAIPRRAVRNSSTFSMGVDFADINRDGHDDFLVLDMMSRDHPRRMRQRAMAGQNLNDIGRIDDRPQVERNTLQLNRGDNTYAEIAQLSGVQASEWSWGLVFLDVDLDGFEDVLITTGHGFDTQDSDTEARITAMGPLPSSKIHTKLLMYPRLNVAKVAFRNRHDLSFEDASQKWGFDDVGVSHGIAMADLDNDGDSDVVVNNLNQAVGIYRNESGRPRMVVQLRGPSPNTQGIGARLTVRGGPVVQTQEIITGGRYLSGDVAERVFAAGETTNGLTLEVAWPSGARSVITNALANHRYEIAAPGQSGVSGGLPLDTLTTNRSPAFSEVSFLEHRHREDAFDDFSRQPLLLHRLSQLGPGVAWCDIDGDGWEDLLLGTGRGGAVGLFRNRQGRSFDRLEPPGWTNSDADTTTILGWSTGPGTSTLLVGKSNYENEQPSSPMVRYECWAGGIEAKESLPPQIDSGGPMAVADVDGDGDLDLFVGGRVRGGRYPEGAISRLFRKEGDIFKLSFEWADLGLVSGAVFSDVSGDGFPELIVAVEWGPIRLFRRANDRWVDETRAWGLTNYSGWWNGVTAGDFNNDGRMDIVASNWGRNHRYQLGTREGARLAYGDLAERGGIEGVLAYKDRGRWVPARDLDALSRGLPWLQARFATHKSFSEASLEEVLGDKPAKILEAHWFDSTLFLNRGSSFAAQSLPVEAQFAPAFALCVADYDGDGNEDLFLSQNFFAVDASMSRADAGRGLWLKGDGTGRLRTIPAAESGIEVYGEQRGAAAGDFDHDGRVDLIVTQNGAESRLFRNETGIAGIRVRLSGPPGNPVGLGAVLQFSTGDRPGAAREIHGGGGYWSQDGPVPVIGTGGAAGRLRVRWPGGSEQVVGVVEGAREVVVKWEQK